MSIAMCECSKIRVSRVDMKRNKKSQNNFIVKRYRDMWQGVLEELGIHVSIKIIYYNTKKNV